MIDVRPGLRPERLLRLMRSAVSRCRLDLRGAVVLTEAATGAYCVTPVLAAMAGAERVIAVTKPSPYGTEDDVRQVTSRIARLAGVEDRLDVVTKLTPALVGMADVVTNSGHVRPIDAEAVSWMKSGAVVSLMYESWEFRQADVDLEACRARGVMVGGTDETHPDVGVFDFLGVLAVKLLHDAGVAVHGNDILLICDNRFGPFLERSLHAFGANVRRAERPRSAGPGHAFDAVLFANTPRPGSELTPSDARAIASLWPGSPLVQFWGEVDRESLRHAGVPVWPVRAPRPGHMGVIPSEVGPEPVVRLQAGGLKVGEILWRKLNFEFNGHTFIQPIGHQLKPLSEPVHS